MKLEKVIKISFLASTNDFAILSQRVGISKFPPQIQNPLEIWA